MDSVTGSLPLLPAARLPRPVEEGVRSVASQLDQETVDSQSVAAGLLAVCKEVREAHPLNRATAEAEARARAVTRVHGLANRIALATAQMQVPGPLQPAMSQTLRLLSEQWQAAVDDVYRGGAIETAEISSQAPSDLIEWVEVPAGTFLFGREDKPVELPTFWVSRYPVTRGQYDQFVKATGHPTTISWEDREGERDHPATVDFYDAKAFSRWAGCRLPSEAEWEKAGRGTDGRNFPWGDEWDPDRCNNDGAGTTSVREHESENVSPYGAVDMSGNVFEWIDEGTKRRPGAVLMKGGSWGNYVREGMLPYELAHHTSILPDSYYAACGFRVVTTTRPAGGPPPPVENRPTPSPAASPAPPAPGLDSLRERIRHRVDEASSGRLREVQPLVDDLTTLSREVRDRRPLEGASTDPQVRRAVADANAAANHVAMHAALRVAGGATSALAADVCTRHLRKAMLQLDDAVNRVLSAPVRVGDTRVGDPGLEWRDVPAGSFQYGRDGLTRTLPAFQISKYPVTNAQYRQFVEDTGYKPQGGWRTPASGHDEEWADHPAVHVTHYDALAYCRWAGGRLPSEPEWEKAARGTDGRQYPWGTEWRDGSCNNEMAGTTPVTRYESVNTSPYGVVDMVGNVLEWTSTSSPNRPGAILTKGGAWHNFSRKAFDAIRYTSEPPDVAHGACGFRVARDA